MKELREQPQESTENQALVLVAFVVMVSPLHCARGTGIEATSGRPPPVRHDAFIRCPVSQGDPASDAETVKSWRNKDPYS